MRGKAEKALEVINNVRITPAHAGKRSVAEINRGEVGDHPRTCGEKNCFWYEEQIFTGSPPHMRGKGRFFSEFCERFRITPAHAGKSCRKHFR